MSYLPVYSASGNAAFSIASRVAVQRRMNDYYLDVTAGRVTGVSSLHKFGSATVSSTVIPIWDGNAAYPWPVTAETVRVKAGGNAADTAAGAGAREITIVGLDENFDEVTEAVATAGASASAATTATFSRVFRAYVSSCGTYGAANTAAVTIENTSASQDIAIIGVENGQTLMAIWTVPNNREFYLDHVHLNVDSNKSADMVMWRRENADDWTTAPFSSNRIMEKFGGVSGGHNIELLKHMSIPAKTDIWITGVIATSGEVDASFGGHLVDTTL